MLTGEPHPTDIFRSTVLKVILVTFMYVCMYTYIHMLLERVHVISVFLLTQSERESYPDQTRRIAPVQIIWMELLNQSLLQTTVNPGQVA